MNTVHVPRRFVRTEWGGTETVILQTCRRLIAMGHGAAIYCPSALSDTVEEIVCGVPVRRFPYFYPYFGLSGEARHRLDKKGGNLFSFSLMRALRAVEGLDLVHLHTGKRLGGAVRHVARRRGIPYVVTLHGGVHDIPAEEEKTFTEPTKGAWEWGKLLGWWVGSRRVLDDAAAILCVGREEWRRTSERHPGKRVEYLPNGVDTGRFSAGDGISFRERYGIPPGVPLVLVMGRIDPQKNQLMAVRVLRRLKDAGGEAHLLMVGPVTDADYCEKVREAVREMSLGSSVTLIPGLPPEGPDLADAYHSADVFLLPSVHEPFGIVILEAWAAGLPVVAAAVGGVPAFVEDGVDGLLFPPGDEAKCAECVSSLLVRPEARGALGLAGRRKAGAEYSWDRITERLERIYESVCETPGHGRGARGGIR